MSTLLDVLSWALILIGSFAALTASLGLLRLPDFFSRTHAGGILDTMGAGTILLGFALQAGFSLVAAKLALVLIFILITGPTAAHALARSALHYGERPETDRETDSEIGPEIGPLTDPGTDTATETGTDPDNDPAARRQEDEPSQR